MATGLSASTMPDAGGMISLWAALIAGLSGSAHCLAMCGGLAGALGMRARAAGGNAAGALSHALAYHFGRISGYALAGALCGAFGAALQAVLDLSRLSVALRVASGVLLMLVAIRILFAWNMLGWLDGLGARFWRHLQPAARQAASGTSKGRALALGLLWGWLPCGLVYSMLLFAALNTTALGGALIMMAFGIGTLPSMLGSSLLAGQLHAWLSKRWPRLLSGLALLLFGAWMAIMGLSHAGHGTRHDAAHAPAEPEHFSPAAPHQH